MCNTVLLGMNQNLFQKNILGKLNLKAGIGYPCAGQSRAIESSLFLRIWFNFESSDSFGLDPPIGSK